MKKLRKLQHCTKKLPYIKKMCISYHILTGALQNIFLLENINSTKLPFGKELEKRLAFCRARIGMPYIKGYKCVDCFLKFSAKIIRFPKSVFSMLHSIKRYCHLSHIARWQIVSIQEKWHKTIISDKRRNRGKSNEMAAKER